MNIYIFNYRDVQATAVASTIDEAREKISQSHGHVVGICAKIFSVTKFPDGEESILFSLKARIAAISRSSSEDRASSLVKFS